jgi:glycerol uptake facilitator protein
MSPFLAEVLGTALILTIGTGVVANVALPKTKGNGSGYLAVTFGWFAAVFVGVYATATISGAHLNPAVTIGLAVAGKFSWGLVPSYLLAQMIGAMLGAFLAWLAHRQQFNETADAATKLGVFCTSPSIKDPFHNILSEAIATFIFMLGVFYIAAPAQTNGAMDALPVSILVLGIGLGMGGPTGYAINPARDLGPRIMHAILPIKNKGGSDWTYAWVPVLGPIIGAAIAAYVYMLIA